MNNMPSDKPKSGTALVTGAAGIVGPSICDALKSDGWKVAAAGRTLESFDGYPTHYQRPYPADALLAGDLTKHEECTRLVREAEEKLGPVTLLVNNATGNRGGPARFADATPEYCLRIFQVDVLAAIHLTQAALPSLLEHQGQVINVSSANRWVLGPGTLVYSAAKAALETLTEGLAYELLPEGVRANCVRLGYVPGDSWLYPTLGQLDCETVEHLHEDVMREHRQCYSRETAPCGGPEEVGAVIAFLASPAASFINRAVIPVDGAYGSGVLRQGNKVIYNIDSDSGRAVADRWVKNPESELEAWRKKHGL